eukprot:TRINITY_DN3169_c0_g1_i1.p1 TRINITY_DN3169_c0_g1~~TRINITY_DN3169_c0_g1_i1.p1  ORF type:complete len:186 (-),score=25.30 TRINITY_DN3169_c0_g1_i1:108-665(-)
MNQPERPTVRITTTEASDLPIVARLFLEYKSSLSEFDAEFWTTADKEVGSLPGRYSPSVRGSVLLARLVKPSKPSASNLSSDTSSLAPSEMEIVGCVALHCLDDATCELKRLYVRSQARGYGVGKALMRKAIEVAKELGYSRVNINTLQRLTSAVALYQSFGFIPTKPYCTDTTPDAQWMQLSLS